MPSAFPYLLDSFINPTGSNHLSDLIVLHSLQHTNNNDAIEAIQTRIGIISSSVTNSIEYELHNTSGGHNHDGINSRQIVIGPPPYGGIDYVSGTFLFSSSTDIGTVINSFNTFLLSSSAKPNFQVNETNFGASTLIKFTSSNDAVTGSLTGSQLNIIINALTEKSRRLILLAGCDGPYETYSSSYRTIGYLNTTSVFPTESIWYEDSFLTKKILSHFVEYNSMRQITKSIWTVYDNNGITPLYVATDIITYNGLKEIYRERTLT